MWFMWEAALSVKLCIESLGHVVIGLLCVPSALFRFNNRDLDKG